MDKLEWIAELAESLRDSLPRDTQDSTLCDIIAGLDEIAAECRKESST